MNNTKICGNPLLLVWSFNSNLNTEHMIETIRTIYLVDSSVYECYLNINLRMRRSNLRGFGLTRVRINVVRISEGLL